MGSWETAREVLADAQRKVETDRNTSYGNPEDDFEAIALCWTGLLRARGYDVVVTPSDVPRMMTALKLCRDAHRPERDNRTDGVGYLLTLERVEPT